MATFKRGTKFLSAHWLEEDLRTPLTCEVTAVRHGCVYWREAGSTGKAKLYFPEAQASRYVKQILEG